MLGRMTATTSSVSSPLTPVVTHFYPLLPCLWTWERLIATPAALP